MKTKRLHHSDFIPAPRRRSPLGPALAVLALALLVPCAPAQDAGYEQYYANGKRGVKDASGKVVVPAVYDNVRPYEEGFAAVKKDKLWGFMDYSGEMLAPFIYLDVGQFRHGFVAVKRGLKWGYIDRKGRQVIEPAYDDAYPFTGDLAMVSIGNNRGYIDRSGKRVTPMVYDEGGGLYEERARVMLNGKWGFIDNTGREIIERLYDEAGHFSEGLAAVRLENKWGYVDRSGKVVIPVTLACLRAGEFSGGFAEIAQKSGEREVLGLIDRTGKVIARPKYLVIRPFKNGVAFVSILHKGPRAGENHISWGMMDEKGTEIIPVKYVHIQELDDGTYGALARNTQEFRFDRSGKIVRPDASAPEVYKTVSPPRAQPGK